jgi:hypothetical protein
MQYDNQKSSIRELSKENSTQAIQKPKKSDRSTKQTRLPKQQNPKATKPKTFDKWAKQTIKPKQ